MTTPDPSLQRNALLTTRAGVGQLAKRRPDLKYICADITQLIDGLQRDPGDEPAMRQLAERQRTLTDRIGRGS